MHTETYLTTEEAAAYLRLKERKLYQLVAAGRVPCSKVTGKWLFPRMALDRWVAAGLGQPSGGVTVEPPPIIGGSHDPLLEWVVRRSGAGLALLPEGSEAGLSRLAENEIAVAAIHLHQPNLSVDANVAAVQARPGLHDAVVIAFVRREQGLVVAPGNPLGLVKLEDALVKKVRFAGRQKGAGAQLLLEALVAREGQPIVGATRAYPTGSDLALAIRAGDADCGIATRAVANLHGLGFVSLLWERFDLVVRRRTYFEPPVQRLVAALRDPAFAAQAASLGGYDNSEIGLVRLNI
jgi:excisionase family DNA binding protein